MTARKCICIPNAKALEKLPIGRMFYISLIAAILDKATELRIEPEKVLARIGGTYYERIPSSTKEEIERVLTSLLGPIGRWIIAPVRRTFLRGRSYEIHFCVKVLGKATHLRASIGKECITFYYLDPLLSRSADRYLT